MIAMLKKKIEMVELWREKHVECIQAIIDWLNEHRDEFEKPPKKGKKKDIDDIWKEAKDHGEGGTTVGATLQGRVLIIDDVISAGTSVRESIELIRAAGAEPCAVVIALDRMERGLGDLSAVQEVRENYGIPVIAIATLNDLLGFLQNEPEMMANLDAVRAYRDLFGVEND